MLLMIDPRARKIVKEYDIKGKAPHLVRLANDRVWAYTSNTDTGTVSAVNLETGEVQVIPIGERPQGMAFSPDNRRLYVTNMNSDSISVIDTQSKTKTDRSEVTYRCKAGRLALRGFTEDRELSHARCDPFRSAQDNQPRAFARRRAALAVIDQEVLGAIAAIERSDPRTGRVLHLHLIAEGARSNSLRCIEANIAPDDADRSHRRVIHQRTRERRNRVPGPRLPPGP